MVPVAYFSDYWNLERPFTSHDRLKRLLDGDIVLHFGRFYGENFGI